jgi:hypothetical protein
LLAKVADQTSDARDGEGPCGCTQRRSSNPLDVGSYLVSNLECELIFCAAFQGLMYGEQDVAGPKTTSACIQDVHIYVQCTRGMMNIQETGWCAVAWKRLVCLAFQGLRSPEA